MVSCKLVIEATEEILMLLYLSFNIAHAVSLLSSAAPKFLAHFMKGLIEKLVNKLSPCYIVTLKFKNADCGCCMLGNIVVSCNNIFTSCKNIIS